MKGGKGGKKDSKKKNSDDESSVNVPSADNFNESEQENSDSSEDTSSDDDSKGSKHVETPINKGVSESATTTTTTTTTSTSASAVTSTPVTSTPVTSTPVSNLTVIRCPVKNEDLAGALQSFQQKAVNTDLENEYPILKDGDNISNFWHDLVRLIDDIEFFCSQLSLLNKTYGEDARMLDGAVVSCNKLRGVVTAANHIRSAREDDNLWNFFRRLESKGQFAAITSLSEEYLLRCGLHLKHICIQTKGNLQNSGNLTPELSTLFDNILRTAFNGLLGIIALFEEMENQYNRRYDFAFAPHHNFKVDEMLNKCDSDERNRTNVPQHHKSPTHIYDDDLEDLVTGYHETRHDTHHMPHGGRGRGRGRRGCLETLTRHPHILTVGTGLGGATLTATILGAIFIVKNSTDQSSNDHNHQSPVKYKLDGNFFGAVGFASIALVLLIVLICLLVRECRNHDEERRPLLDG